MTKSHIVLGTSVASLIDSSKGCIPCMTLRFSFHNLYLWGAKMHTNAEEYYYNSSLITSLVLDNTSTTLNKLTFLYICHTEHFEHEFYFLSPTYILLFLLLLIYCLGCEKVEFHIAFIAPSFRIQSLFPYFPLLLFSVLLCAWQCSTSWLHSPTSCL